MFMAAIMPKVHSRVRKAEGSALDYAIQVESRLRGQLLQAREALSQERAKNSALAKQLRDITTGGSARPSTTVQNR